MLIPALGHFLPAAQVPGALAIGTSTSSLSRIGILHRSIRWDIVRAFVPAALPGVAMGASLLSFLNPSYVEFLLGLFLLGNLPLIFRSPEPCQESGESNRNLAAIGLAAGFISGLTGAVGVLFNGFYLRSGLTKEEIVATRAANEILLHLAKLAVYTSLGLVTHASLTLGAAVALGALLASAVTQRMLTWVSEMVFRRVGYLTMVISGVSLLWGSAARIAHEHEFRVDYRLARQQVEARFHWDYRQVDFELSTQRGLDVTFEETIGEEVLSAEQRARVAEVIGECRLLRLERITDRQGQHLALTVSDHGRKRRIVV